VVAEDRPLSHPITLRIEKCFSRSRKGHMRLLTGDDDGQRDRPTKVSGEGRNGQGQNGACHAAHGGTAEQGTGATFTGDNPRAAPPVMARVLLTMVVCPVSACQRFDSYAEQHKYTHH
jgi:hypothetical protein